MRPGENKWAASIFARNPDTGKAVWAYQLVPHDNWDYDAVNEDTVVDLLIGGVTRKVIVHFNKDGFAYIRDRATGQLISANPSASANGRQASTSRRVCPKSWRRRTRIKASRRKTFALSDRREGLGYSSYSPSTKLFYFGAQQYVHEL